MTKSKVQVSFIEVRSAASKLAWIRDLAQQHSRSKRPLAILLPGEAACDYLDLHLWEEPKSSFLPHCVGAGVAPVQLYAEGMPEKAEWVLNLRPEPVLLDEPSLRLVYELRDLSHPDRARAAEIKALAYREAGCA
ncbi:MAG: DNA polymerase III subunit chi, partial [Chlamydiia bacterium]|nr:DNA polymerase III subunit chi [Chlamydiia bacterium]